MPTPSQLGGATAGVAVLAGGGYGAYYFTTGSSKTQDSSETGGPSFKPVTQQEATTGIISLIKNENLTKFVSTKQDNKDWWDWAYTNRYLKNKNDTISKPNDNTFNNVNSKEDLSTACDKAYKEDKSKYLFTNNSYLLQNILDFCTSAGNKEYSVLEPKDVITYATDTTLADGYQTGLLSLKANRDHLVKDVDSNKYWFEWSLGTRKELNKPVGTSSLFSGVTSGYGDTNSLRKACDGSYKEQGTLPPALLKEVSTYCTVTIDTPLKDPNTLLEPTTLVTTFSTTSNLEDDYSSKLLGIVKKSNRDKFVKAVGLPTDTNTQTWWESSFTKRFSLGKNKGNLENTPFSTVTIAYSPTESTTALNWACDKAYKLEQNKYEFGLDKHLVKKIVLFCAKPVEETVDLTEPEPLTHKDTTIEDWSEYKFGILDVGTNKQHLVKKENTSNNNYWWEWAFHNLYETDKQGVSPSFTGINKGYLTTDANGNKGLNNACDAAYKKMHDEFNNGETGKLLKEISKYCSPTKTPETLTAVVQDAEPTNSNLLLSTDTAWKTTYSSGVGKVDANGPLLVIPGDKANTEAWWNHTFRQRYLRGLVGFDLHSEFQGLTKGYSDSEGEPKALNQACKKAYNLDNAQYKADGDKLLKNVKKFCAKEKDKESVQAPTA